MQTTTKKFLTGAKFKIFLAALGTLDASYLTWEHYAKSSVFCLSANSCDRVLSSAYATVGALPVSAVGVLYYATLLALSMYLFISGDGRALPLFFYLAAAGLAVSLVLVGLQVFVIRAICYYCMLSALLTSLLFIAGYRSIHDVEMETEKA